jgi:hypothetical protein
MVQKLLFMLLADYPGADYCLSFYFGPPDGYNCLGHHRASDKTIYKAACD